MEIQKNANTDKLTVHIQESEDQKITQKKGFRE